MSYDRYSLFRSKGKIEIVPSVTIAEKETDYYETYKVGSTSLNDLSYKYYGDPNYDWLIMVANPQYGSMEFSIPNGVEIRIPYPLSTSIEQYTYAVNNYNRLYKKI